LEDGWHFVKVLDARQPFVPTLEQVRADLVRTLRGERSRSGTQDYLSKKLQETPVVINELAVSKLLLPVSTPEAAAKP
jgi:parvulin-like peptidyl-prolyl isomerase